MIGTCAILNVGMGDTKLSFDPASPEDRKRAAATVADMLRRGFAIMVQVGERNGKPLYQRIDSFDEATCEYIIVGLPEDLSMAALGTVEEPAPPPARPKPARGRPGRKAAAKTVPRTRLPAERTAAVAVGRSAGG
jgi:hypothetical protein